MSLIKTWTQSLSSFNGKFLFSTFLCVADTQQYIYPHSNTIFHVHSISRKSSAFRLGFNNQKSSNKQQAFKLHYITFSDNYGIVSHDRMTRVQTVHFNTIYSTYITVTTTNSSSIWHKKLNSWPWPTVMVSVICSFFPFHTLSTQLFITMTFFLQTINILKVKST